MSVISFGFFCCLTVALIDVNIANTTHTSTVSASTAGTSDTVGKTGARSTNSSFTTSTVKPPVTLKEATTKSLLNLNESSNITIEIASMNETYFAVNDTDLFFNETIPGVEKNGSFVFFPNEGVPSQSWLGLDNICSCDLKVHICDINCCCDSDCSATDRSVFSKCYQPSLPVVDLHHCFQENILFSNFTEYKMQVSKTGLFCIATNNLPQRQLFLNVKGINNIQSFSNMKRDTRNYNWIQDVRQPRLQHSQKYQVGSPVWAVNRDGDILQLNFPSSVLGENCDSSTPFKFLQNFETSCARTFENILTSCPENEILNARFYSDFLVIKDPRRLLTIIATTDVPLTTKSGVTEGTGTPTEDYTVTGVPMLITPSSPMSGGGRSGKELIEHISLLRPDLSIDNLLPIKIYFCESGTDKCTENKSVDSLSTWVINNVCVNVVTRISFIVIHQGGQIDEVRVEITAKNMTVGMNRIRQLFNVHYTWKGQYDSDGFLQRSGRPGYVVGLPILMGRIVTNTSNAGELKEAVKLSLNPRDWMTVFSPDASGGCQGPRRMVTFGRDMYSGCSLPIMKRGENREGILKGEAEDLCVLQKTVLTLLLGNMQKNMESVRIGMYGDASVNNAADWVPLILPEEPRLVMVPGKNGRGSKCTTIITSLRIEILHAWQGALANPQAKVIGVIVSYGEPIDVLNTCLAGLRCLERNVQLSTSVTFTDVTVAPVPAYARPPTLDVKLPYDFFYPFLPTSGAASLGYLGAWTSDFLMCGLVVLSFTFIF